MNKDLDLWQFIASRLKSGEAVMMLVVAESSGSSPGRAGYKMAVSPDGDLCGSIGGGVMEVNLVEQARAILSEVATGFLTSRIVEQVHQKNSQDASGMICSGRQTVIFQLLTSDDAGKIDEIIVAIKRRECVILTITSTQFIVGPPEGGTPNESPHFEMFGENEFTFTEKLGIKNRLFIVGGGHCCLALSGLMSKLDFHVSIFDDRPELNTIHKNQFADAITIVDSYENIAQMIASGTDTYVVVMTIGYKFDEIVIRALFEKDFRYFGVLGSRAKMKTLLKSLENAGFAKDRLARIRTPIGLPINSRTPEEIAVSIAAEIISVKNSKA